MNFNVLNVLIEVYTSNSSLVNGIFIMLCIATRIWKQTKNIDFSFCKSIYIYIFFTRLYWVVAERLSIFLLCWCVALLRSSFPFGTLSSKLLIPSIGLMCSCSFGFRSHGGGKVMEQYSCSPLGLLLWCLWFLGKQWATKEWCGGSKALALAEIRIFHVDLISFGELDGFISGVGGVQGFRRVKE